LKNGTKMALAEASNEISFSESGQMQLRMEGKRSDNGRAGASLVF